ncbi:Uncharacterised protein [uncultured archaeon]|nr:Uncharacterised protein [uncultured archaeon]
MPTCKVCGKSFKSEKELYAHYAKEHDKGYV